MAEFFLSESDLTAIRDLMRKTPIRPRDVDEVPASYGAPEVYVARSPDGGIPALEAYAGTGTGKDQPGAAFCYVYRIQPVGTGTAEGIVPLDGSFRRVINLSSSEIEEGKWFPVVRDKFGSWLVVGDTRADETAIVQVTFPTPVDGARYTGVAWRQDGLPSEWNRSTASFIYAMNFADFPGRSKQFGRRAIDVFQDHPQYAVNPCCAAAGDDDDGEVGGSLLPYECSYCDGSNIPEFLCVTVTHPTDCYEGLPTSFQIFLSRWRFTSSWGECYAWFGTFHYGVDIGTTVAIQVSVWFMPLVGFRVLISTNFINLIRDLNGYCEFLYFGYPSQQSWTNCDVPGTSIPSEITLSGIEITALPANGLPACDCIGEVFDFEISSVFTSCEEALPFDALVRCCGTGTTLPSKLYVTLTSADPDYDGLEGVIFLTEYFGDVFVRWVGGVDDTSIWFSMYCNEPDFRFMIYVYKNTGTAVPPDGTILCAYGGDLSRDCSEPVLITGTMTEVVGDDCASSPITVTITDTP